MTTSISSEEEEIFEIVQREEESSCRLSYVHEMTEIAESITLRYSSLMLAKHRYFFLTIFVLFSAYLQIPIRGECLSMSTDARGKDTVHHIDPSSNSFDEIFWSPDTHEIVRLLDWEDGREYIEDTIHIFPGFSDRESSDRDTREIERLDKFAGFASQIIVHDSLDYTKEGLRVKSLIFANFRIYHPLIMRAHCPTMSPLHSSTSILTTRSSWSTLIERHDDICSEC
jgi:hypothetical protein